MGLRDELRKKFSGGKSRSSSHASHDTKLQEDQATIKLHVPTPPPKHADLKQFEV